MKTLRLSLISVTLVIVFGVVVVAARDNLLSVVIPAKNQQSVAVTEVAEVAEDEVTSMEDYQQKRRYCRNLQKVERQPCMKIARANREKAKHLMAHVAPAGNGKPGELPHDLAPAMQR